MSVANQLFTDWLTGDVITAVKLNSMKNNLARDADRTDWTTAGTFRNVVGQIAWRNFGAAGTIFDASNSQNPIGGAISNTNPTNGWVATYPTLMAFDGSNTYGVRVDTSRNAENLNGQAPSFYAALNGTNVWSGTSNTFTNGIIGPGISSNSTVGIFNASAMQNLNARSYRAGTVFATLDSRDPGAGGLLLTGNAFIDGNIGNNGTWNSNSWQKAVNLSVAGTILWDKGTGINYIGISRTNDELLRFMRSTTNNGSTAETVVATINVTSGSESIAVMGNIVWHGGNFNPALKLDVSTAASTYLTQTSAASTYLTQTSAASTYATLAGNPNFTGLPTVSSNRIVDRGSFIDGSYTQAVLGANTSVSTAVTVTGAAVGDMILCSFAGGPGGPVLLSGFCATANSVTVVAYNASASATPGTTPVNIRVFKRTF